MFGNSDVEIGPFNPTSTKSQATRDQSLAQSLASSNNWNIIVQIVKMTSFGDCAMSYQSKLSKVANYRAWKFRMKNILMQEMFWHLISLDHERAFMNKIL